MACLLLPMRPVTRPLLCLFLALTTPAAAQITSLQRPKNHKPAAAFVAQSVPTAMNSGQTYAVAVTMANNGAKTWDSKFQLGSQNPPNNSKWGLNHVAVSPGTTVPSGGTYIFSFNVTAPAAAGTYSFQWRMKQGKTWFGAVTPNVTVTVSAAAPTPTPSPSPTATPTPTPTASPTPDLGKASIYIAHLRAQTAGSTGSGTAILKLSQDETFATVAFSYSNLSSPVISKHVHGPASPGQSAGILFDPDGVDAVRNSDGSFLWIFKPVGTNAVADIVAAIKSGRTYFNIHTSLSPTGEIIGFFNASGGNQVVPVPTPPPPLASGTPTAEDASRFLNQCTCGATAPLIQKVQQQGFEAFLNEQFALPASSNLAFLDGQTSDPDPHDTLNAWWTLAITAPDQVRQRVAFALSEILVTSFNNGAIYEHPEGMSVYIDLLANGAFGNYRHLLQDVTLSPTMGVYLDMLRNDVADPDSGSHPNENYARELMQLFSVGLYRFNIDGSLTLDAEGSPIATYGQPDVSGLAAVTTGWTFAGSSDFWDSAPNFREPMMAFPGHHTTEAKAILNGVVIPPNQAPEQDLNQALDTIFNHPNVGKFIGRELIQRLVTSNPSPGYLYRVASAFDNNGQGVRGDMKAVIKAILLDYDARGPSRTGQGAGKEKEPALRLTSLYRALKSNPADGIYSFWLADEFGQTPLFSPTVFNFFSPDYVAPGAIALAGLASPEFQITTETTVVEQANTIYAALFWQDIPLDLTQEETLADDPAALVDYFNGVLMNSAMSAGMRSVLIDTIGKLPSDDSEERVLSALWLILNSPEYVIEK